MSPLLIGGAIGVGLALLAAPLSAFDLFGPSHYFLAPGTFATFMIYGDNPDVGWQWDVYPVVFSALFHGTLGVLIGAFLRSARDHSGAGRSGARPARGGLVRRARFRRKSERQKVLEETASPT